MVYIVYVAWEAICWHAVVVGVVVAVVIAVVAAAVGCFFLFLVCELFPVTSGFSVGCMHYLVLHFVISLVFYMYSMYSHTFSGQFGNAFLAYTGRSGRTSTDELFYS